MSSWSAREDENRRLLRARDTVDRMGSQGLDVASLAAVAHMSAAHFSRRFADLFGQTPHRYLQRRRIERACAWLRDTQVPVTEIAFAVGYQSLGTFSRTFRAVTGTSPAAYRAAAEMRLARVPVCLTAAWGRIPG